MKFNVWKTALAPPKRHTREFTTPAGDRFSLTLEEADITHIARGAEFAQQLAAVYVTGDANSDGVAATFPLVGGRRVPMTEPLVREAAAVAACQPEDLGSEERWTPEELVALALQCGIVWSRDVQPWISAVTGGQKAVERDLGNASPAPAENSSSRPAPETASIPNSPSGETPSSGPSTSASASSAPAGVNLPADMRSAVEEQIREWRATGADQRAPA